MIEVPPSSPNRFAWLVLGLLFASSVVNYVDRVALAVVKPQICEELSITNQGYGLALNAFVIAYMALCVVDVAGYAPAFVCVGVIYLPAIASLVAAGRIEPLR